jgi:hypothetical protein
MLSQEIKTAFDEVKKLIGDHGTLQALGVVWQAIEEAAGGVQGEAEAAAQKAEADRVARIAALQAQQEAAAKELAQLQPSAPTAPDHSSL